MPDMLGGDARGAIAGQIVQLHSEYYGKGPTRARVHASGDVVAVVLEETFTRAERTLIERGEADGIRNIRRRFQRVMADQFKEIVEQATGRRVRSFFSDTDLDEDLSIELFVLHDGNAEATDFDAEEQEPAGEI